MIALRHPSSLGIRGNKWVSKTKITSAWDDNYSACWYSRAASLSARTRTLTTSGVLQEGNNCMCGRGENLQGG